MSTQTLISLAFPLVLGLIMCGLGTSLTWAHFQNVKKAPRAIFIGLAIQMFLGPVLAFAVIHAFSFTGPLAFGFLLLSAVPGGTTSNVFSYLAKGDVALNIALTAINSFLGVVYIPLFLYFMSDLVLDNAQSIPVPAAKIAQTIFIVLIPVVLGMLFRKYKPAAAKKIEPLVHKVAIVFILILMLVGIKNEWDVLTQSGITIACAVLVFNMLSLFAAYAVSRLSQLQKPQAIAITFEVGIHNCILAMTLAVSPHLFNSMEMALPAIFYSLIMQFTAGALVKWFRRV